MEYSGKYLIVGNPGAGKTTRVARTVARIIREHSGPVAAHACPVIVASLTKAAAHKAASCDMPIPDEAIGTMHAHAYRMLDKPTIAETKVADFNREFPQFALTNAKGDPEDRQEPPLGAAKNLGDAALNAYQLARARCTPRDLWNPAILPFVAAWEAWKRGNEFIDFSDMIERAVSYSPHAPCRAGVVIVDEAQDMSRLELRLAEKWGELGGALILVGDPFQNLYRWRGGDETIFYDDVPESHRDTLRQSWRVPDALAKRAMRFAMTQSGLPRDIEERMRYKGLDAPCEIKSCIATPQFPDPILPEIERTLSTPDETVMVLASCSYLVNQTVSLLRRHSIPFHNPMRPANGMWNPLSAKGVTMGQRLLTFLGQFRDTPERKARPWTFEQFASWTEHIKADKFFKRGKKAELLRQAKDDPHVLLPIYRLHEWLEPQAADEVQKLLGLSTPEQIEWWRSRLLPEKQERAAFATQIAQRKSPDLLRDTPRCLVGTVHSFKGEEADSVILFPDLSMAGYEAWNMWNGGSKARDGVIRMLYVGMTRAKKRFTLCQGGNRKAEISSWVMRDA
jgi:superfamily I DNA/RNA helicase